MSSGLSFFIFSSNLFIAFSLSVLYRSCISKSVCDLDGLYGGVLSAVPTLTSPFLIILSTSSPKDFLNLNGNMSADFLGLNNVDSLIKVSN